MSLILSNITIEDTKFGLNRGRGATEGFCYLFTSFIYNYSWSLNNMGLNFAVHLNVGYFQLTVLRVGQSLCLVRDNSIWSKKNFWVQILSKLVSSSCPWMNHFVLRQREHYLDFQLCEGGSGSRVKCTNFFGYRMCFPTLNHQYQAHCLMCGKMLVSYFYICWLQKSMCVCSPYNKLCHMKSKY